MNQLEGSGMVSATKQSTTNGSGGGGKDGGNVKRLSIEADDSPPPPPLNTAASPTTTPSRDQGKGGTKGKKSANEKALVKAGLSVGKTIVAGNFGSRYVIIFVPLLGSGSGSGSDGGLDNKNHGNKNGGGGFGGFRARNKGGQQQSGVVLSNSKDTSIDNDASSVVTSATSTSTQHQDSGSSATTHQGQQQQQQQAVPLSTSQTKEIKELYHKFLKDFPNGRTVIMGSLLNSDTEAQQGVGGRPIQNQEWKAFLHNLGNAIVDGFHDRVCRYSEELRRLDSKRINATADSSKLFDLSHFFLVKESLAFTYEQMQLYEEAKLQYEELYAFLPEDGWRNSLTTEASDGEENDNEEDGISSSSQSSQADLAIAGDSTNFRQYIQVSGKDLQGVSQYLPQYMYAREVRLLFQMGGSDIGNSSSGGGGSSSAAVDVLTLSTNFIQQNY